VAKHYFYIFHIVHLWQLAEKLMKRLKSQNNQNAIFANKKNVLQYSKTAETTLRKGFFIFMLMDIHLVKKGALPRS